MGAKRVFALLDEITSALDPATEQRILETVRELSRSKAVLLITHNPQIAHCADHVYTLSP